jgi:hypothetical protein
LADALRKYMHMFIEEMSEMCWLKDGCPGKTAACYNCQPTDEGCPVYRWFRELILEKEKKIDEKLA